jgi:sugar phosphate isomerase/epimerase
MMIGVSSSGYTSDCSITECMKQIKNAGYDSVDLNLYDFCQPDGPMMASTWKIWVNEVQLAARDAGVIIGQIHALFGIFAAPDLTYEPPSEIFYRNIEACAMLECSELVFHQIFYRAIVDTKELRARLIEYNARWFKELLTLAKVYGIHIDLENTFDRRPQPYAPPFSTVSDLIELVEAIGDESVGICLDTGHANIMSFDISTMIRALGSKLRVLHLNDNLGSIEPCSGQSVLSDQHFFPGTGIIDFSKVFMALKEIGYNGIINLEPGDFLTRLSISARNASIAGGASVARAFLKEFGLE